MANKNFWNNREKEPSEDVDTQTTFANYLLVKENEVLRKEVNDLREQLYEVKSIMSKLKMSLDMISNILKDNVRDKLDFIREVISEIT